MFGLGKVSNPVYSMEERFTGKFTFAIDRGGTFTDIYAKVRRPQQEFSGFYCLVSIKVPGEPGYRVVKLLSVDPDNYDDAPREVFTAIL